MSDTKWKAKNEVVFWDEDGRRYHIKMGLGSYLGQEYRFKFWVEGDELRLLDLYPVLRKVQRMGGRDEDGAPLYTVENGKFRLEREELPYIKEHFLCGDAEAEELISRFKRGEPVESIVDNFRPKWKKAADEALQVIKEWEPENHESFSPDDPLIWLDGDDRPTLVEKINNYPWGDGDVVEVEAGSMWLAVAKGWDAASEAVAEYWRDLISNDPKEFTAIIGEERLVVWALGQSDQYGISSLEEFIKVASNYPEEDLGLYDGVEYTGRVNEAFLIEAGWDLEVGEDGWVEVLYYRR